MALIRVNKAAGANLDNATLTKSHDPVYNDAVTISATVGDFFIIDTAQSGFTSIVGASVISSITADTSGGYTATGITILKATATSIVLTPVSTTWVGTIAKIEL